MNIIKNFWITSIFFALSCTVITPIFTMKKSFILIRNALDQAWESIQTVNQDRQGEPPTNNNVAPQNNENEEWENVQLVRAFEELSAQQNAPNNPPQNRQPVPIEQPNNQDNIENSNYRDFILYARNSNLGQLGPNK